MSHFRAMSSGSAEPGSEGVFKHFAFAFVLAVVCYVGFYSCDSHLRLRKGPWELTFKNEVDGTPTVVINQHQVGITNVTLRLSGELVEQKVETVQFTGPGIQVPFGKVVFFDTTYLPGTLTLDLLGHEVELLERTLIVNFKDHPWQSGEVITLRAEDKWQASATNRVDEAIITATE